MAIKYSINGRCKNQDAVDIYVCNLLKALKIHRLSTKNIEIEFKNRLEGDAQGFCVLVIGLKHLSRLRESLLVRRCRS